MEKSIQGYLGSLQLGEVQLFKNLAMVPVVSDYDDGLGTSRLGRLSAPDQSKSGRSARAGRCLSCGWLC